MDLISYQREQDLQRRRELWQVHEDVHAWSAKRAELVRASMWSSLDEYKAWQKEIEIDLDRILQKHDMSDILEKPDNEGMAMLPRRLHEIVSCFDREGQMHNLEHALDNYAHFGKDMLEAYAIARGAFERHGQPEAWQTWEDTLLVIEGFFNDQDIGNTSDIQDGFGHVFAGLPKSYRYHNPDQPKWTEVAYSHEVIAQNVPLALEVGMHLYTQSNATARSFLVNFPRIARDEFVRTGKQDQIGKWLRSIPGRVGKGIDESFMEDNGFWIEDSREWRDEDDVYEDTHHVVFSDSYWPESSKEKTTSVYDALISQRIKEQDAEALVAAFNDLQSCRPAALLSKNIVYHVTDAKGSRKVVKFVHSKREAEIEALVGYHFSRHQVLDKYFARVDMQKPVKVDVGGATKYMIVQEDVDERASKAFESLLIHGNKRQVTTYVHYWMRVFADVHIHGTHIMNRESEFHAARGMNSERDQDRLDLTNMSYDSGLRGMLVSIHPRVLGEFMDGDTRFANRKGQIKVDCGNAGREYAETRRQLDLVGIMECPLVYRVGWNENDTKRAIGVYLQRRKQNLGRNHHVTKEEVDLEYHRYREQDVLFNQRLGPVLALWNGKSMVEERSLRLIKETSERKEAEIIKLGRGGLTNYESENDIVYEKATA